MSARSAKSWMGSTPAASADSSMPGEVITLLLALAGVGGLVLAARFAQAPTLPQLESIDEVRHLLTVLPGGFHVVRTAIDHRSRYAIASDQRGRVAVICPVGAHYFVRLCDAACTARAAAGLLLVEGRDFSAKLALAEDAAAWAQAAHMSGARA